MRWILLVLATVLAASPAMADKGMLQVSTDPGGARVLVDGARKGNSPTEAGQSFIIQLPAGDHVIEAVLPVNDDTERYGKVEVFVADDTVQPVKLKLAERLTGEKGARLRNLPPPKMVAIPPGSFMMGSSDGVGSEKPIHRVTINYAFELSATPITFDQWEACLADGGCDGYKPSDQGWGRGDRPVINVSWDDAQKYLQWLNRKTGKKFRLPSEAEWEYAARAGTTTEYWWGDEVGNNNANCLSCGSQWDNKQTAPVASFRANPFGLYDMNGNVWQWVQDCIASYQNAPADGSTVLGSGSCGRRVLRGGSWDVTPDGMRSAHRARSTPDGRIKSIGFRVARTLP